MKNIRIITLILAVFMTLSFFSFSAFAEEVTDPTQETESTTTTDPTSPTEPSVDYKVSGDWKYKDINDKSIQIVGYTGTDSKCIIPGTLEGKTVASVAKGIVTNNSTIIEAVIDGNVTDFSPEAFVGCTALKRVTLKKGKLLTFDIKYCPALEIIDLPETVKTIGKLDNCPMLQKINVDSKSTVFKTSGGIVFTADAKTLVKYPAGKKLARFAIPKSITTIADNAFYQVKKNVKEIYVPSTVVKMGASAFTDATPKVLFQAEKIPEGCAAAVKNLKTECSQVNLGVTKKVASTQNASSIKLTWEPVSGATGYEFFYKNGKEWKKLANVSKTTITVKDLKVGTKYTFAIRAFAQVMSGNTKVTSVAPSYATYVAATTPVATSKIVSSQNDSSIKLTWAKVAGADGYAIYYKNAKGGWTHYKNVVSNTITVSGLKSYTKYTFAVRTLIKTDKLIAGGYKEFSAKTTIGKPVVAAKQTKKNIVDVGWKSVAGATHYQVYYKLNNGNWTLLKTYTYKTNGVALQLTGIPVGTKVSVAVCSVRAENNKIVDRSGYNPVTVVLKSM